MCATESLKKYLYDDLIRKAEMEMQENNFIRALELWKIAHRLFPRSGICYRGAALSCMEIDEQEQAEQICTLAEKFADSPLEHLIIRGEIEQRRKNLMEALRIWSIIRKKFPSCLEGYERAIQACLELGDYKQAANLLEEQENKSQGAQMLAEVLASCADVKNILEPKVSGFFNNMSFAPQSSYAELRYCQEGQDVVEDGLNTAMKLLGDGCQIYAVNIVQWKRTFIDKLLIGSTITYIDEKNGIAPYIPEIIKSISKNKRVVFIIWSLSDCKDVIFTARKFSIPIIRVEDGFIRSVGAGVLHVPPYSLCLDRRSMHFDYWHESDLENLIKSFDAKSNKRLLERASQCIDFIVRERITKYNVDKKVNIQDIYGKKKRRRILVIGQVEDDRSIKYGCRSVSTNRRLLEIAIRENPGAQIIFKNHPDLKFGRVVANSSSIKDIADRLVLLEDSRIGIDDALKDVDHVYTMTSLSGFEALMRGVKTSVFGCPFYAGWGLSDDRLFNGRRRGKRTLEEIFACAYLTYPVYFIPETGKITTLENILQIVKNEKNRRAA